MMPQRAVNLSLTRPVNPARPTGLPQVTITTKSPFKLGNDTMWLVNSQLQDALAAPLGSHLLPRPEQVPKGQRHFKWSMRNSARHFLWQWLNLTWRATHWMDKYTACRLAVAQDPFYCQAGFFFFLARCNGHWRVTVGDEMSRIKRPHSLSTHSLPVPQWGKRLWWWNHVKCGAGVLLPALSAVSEAHSLRNWLALISCSRTFVSIFVSSDPASAPTLGYSNYYVQTTTGNTAMFNSRADPSWPTQLQCFINNSTNTNSPFSVLCFSLLFVMYV